MSKRKPYLKHYSIYQTQYDAENNVCGLQNIEHIGACSNLLKPQKFSSNCYAMMAASLEYPSKLTFFMYLTDCLYLLLRVHILTKTRPFYFMGYHSCFCYQATIECSYLNKDATFKRDESG